MHPLLGRKVTGPSMYSDRGPVDIVGHVIGVSATQHGLTVLLVTTDGEDMHECKARVCRVLIGSCVWQTAEAAESCWPVRDLPDGFKALTAWQPIGEMSYGEDGSNVLWRRMIRPVA